MEASVLSAQAGHAPTPSVARLGRAAGGSPWLRLRSDEQLVGLFRSGSDEAFRVIHDRYRPRLAAYARQMLGGSSADAEDAIQDVFLRAYRALRVDERPVSLRAWLYRVAHNRCIDALRRPVPVPSEIFEMSRKPVQDPLAAAERREDLERLVADVRRLPDQQRSALLMREMDGMSYADLAAALDTSVPAVKSLLVRARIGLVEAVEARDTACADIRHDLAASYDRGVRATGRARRHLRDCSACSTYRAQLRSVRRGFASLSPGVAPHGLLAKLLGLGGAGTGGAAAAGGAASAGGGVATAVSVCKVATVVGCAAVVGGGAAQVREIVAARTAPAAHQRPHAAPPAPAAPGVQRPSGVATASAVARTPIIGADGRPRRSETTAAELLLRPPGLPVATPARPRNANGSGGQAAPDAAAEQGAAAPTTPGDAAQDETGIAVTDGILPLGEQADGSSGTAGSSPQSSDSPEPSGASTSSGQGASGSEPSPAPSASGTSTGSGSDPSGSGSSTSGSGTAGSSSGSGATAH